MKGLLGQHINEFISLTIMVLMIASLIAGHADANVQDAIKSDAHFSAAELATGLEIQSDTLVEPTDIVIRLNLDSVIAADAAIEVVDVLREIVDIQLTTND
jgi:hypothetical protein